MQINYQALTEVVTGADIADYKAYKKSGSNKNNLMAISFTVAIILFISLFAIKLFVNSTSSIIMSLLILCIMGSAVFFVVRYKNIKNAKLYKFALANNLDYIDLIPNPADAGVIFQCGINRKNINIIRSRDSNFFEIGNHQYKIETGTDYEHLVTNGYIKLKLNRNLPHMVLDSKKNNFNLFGASVSNLPAGLKSDQVLSLEGDFDKYFTLYAPKEYERDALYIFTPDLMALFIDNVGDFDSEIIDDYLYVYSNKAFDMLNQTLLEKIFNIVDIIFAKSISRTEHYSDERAGNMAVNIIANSGKRLKRKIPWLIIIFITIVAVTYLFMSV